MNNINSTAAAANKHWQNTTSPGNKAVIDALPCTVNYSNQSFVAECVPTQPLFSLLELDQACNTTSSRFTESKDIRGNDEVLHINTQDNSEPL